MGNTRLFFAVRPDETVMDMCRAYVAKRQEAGIRWIKEENWHVTTLFVGNFPEEQVGDLINYFDERIKILSPFSLEFEKFTLYPLRSPNMVWAKFRTSEAFSNFVRTSHQLTREFIRKNNTGTELKSGHGEIPHITLSRLKGQIVHPGHYDFIPGSSISFRSGNVYLIQSELLSAGARYTDLHDFGLCGK